MTAEAGRPDFDPGIDEDPVLYVVDDGPDGPDELLRLVPGAGEPAPAGLDPDEAEAGPPDDETNGQFRALPH